MKKLSLFVFVLIPFLSFSQPEKEISKNLSNEFERHYNADGYELIFGLFSDEMKKALPVEQTIDFLRGLKSQAGKIMSREFIKYENSTYASYKTKFERATFAVNISHDKDARINGLFVKPFKEENLPKLERNQTKLILPFKGEWTVVWGGDTKELNYHVENEARKNAIDLVVTDSF